MTDPKPRRGMPRALIYAAIPLGFVVFVLFLVLGGEAVQEDVIPGPTEVEETE
ncbi:nicotinate phosphoribosyltransferase [Pseudooceanicola nanhaiensis]|uniref:nicotinate phosphoribosyltransferase n=1 Tax=Pseudooceanicola nanhaiensis TaxID=375761 RepID=UPI0035131CF5